MYNISQLAEEIMVDL